MERRKEEDRHTRSLNKTTGRSTYIASLPIGIVRDLGWKAKQKLEVRRHGAGILIRDWKPDKR